MGLNPRRRRRSTGSSRMPRPHASRTADHRRGNARQDDRGDAPTGIEEFPRDPGSLDGLDEVIDDFTEDWSRGNHPRAEGYLDRLPGDARAELIYHEYCLAESANLDPDPCEYLRRFPEQARPLERLFALHGAVSVSSLRRWVEPSDLPDPGDEIGPYLLVRELGRGSFARVFLAEQSDLGDRLVVVKVSTRATAEPQLLAKARHAHIVEVLRQAEANDGALHLVCMPFLGGATLASVLEERRRSGRRPTAGRHLLADLDRVSAPEYPPAELARPAREVVAKLSYPRAVAWIVARLAEALDHARSRGVTHGDLKPSNILITAEGTPMLFDFNLAVDWHKADADGSTGDAGGTLAYMAPERLLALAGRGAGTPSHPPDRHLADLYALGLVLLEALSGRTPSSPRDRQESNREFAATLAESRRDLVRSLRSRRYRSIPASLRAILSRCLSFDPLDRYASGKELAEDLDRWRLDLSLVHAEESRRSGLARRARKGRLGLTAGVLTLVTAGIVGYFAAALIAGTKREQALGKLSMILDRPDSRAFMSRKFGQWRWFEEPIDPAVLATQHLALYAVEADPDWRSRDDIRALPDREREELEAWLSEQVLRLSVALRARPDSPGDWRRALALVDRTVAQVPFSALSSERLALRARLNLPPGEPRSPRAARPPRWLDDYLNGVAAEPTFAREAIDHYQEVLRQRPEMFWAHYRSASALARVGEYPEATDHMRRCVARRPKNPQLHTFLATFLRQTGCESLGSGREAAFNAALDECDRALALDPDFAEANSIKARIHMEAGRVEGVDAQINRFALLTKYRGRSQVSVLRLAVDPLDGQNRDEKTAMSRLEMAREAVAENPQDQENRAILAHELNNKDRALEAAESYNQVLSADPDHLRARFSRASLLYHSDLQAANAEFAALIEHPRFPEVFRYAPEALRAYHYTATALLKEDKVEEALAIAHRCLAQLNSSRTFQVATIKPPSTPPGSIEFEPREETYYLLARIHAVAARSDREQLSQAVAYLERATRVNPKYRDQWFATDRLFDPVRPEVLRRLGELPPEP